ncbi:hypothetical protein [Shewanella mangrovisoli]|uniref:Secreted protein n=1 Tax=Shewanella mangrovisoli TaxID=2864211 RepID=A0ABV4VHA1_9GAMM
MNSSIVVKIAIVATVTVGGMTDLSHPCERGIYTSMCCRCRRRAYRDTSCEIKGWRVTWETVAMHITQYPIRQSCLGKIAFSQMNSSMVVKIAIVETVTVSSMAAISHSYERGISTSMCYLKMGLLYFSLFLRSISRISFSIKSITFMPFNT